MSAEYELTFNDYLSMFKRRWVQSVVVAVLVLATAIALAFLLPVTYESKGTILVESQRIPTELVQATVTSYATERIEVIRQRVMTRDNLYRIIKKYNLYPKKVESASTSELIDKVREAIRISIVDASFGSGQDQATISFDVGFQDEKPDVAQKVANELVTLFLDENVRSRNERAVETTEFLTEELNRLKAELEAVENKVAAYKQAHENALPEHMGMYMTSIERAGADIKEVDRDYRTTQEELRYLDVELTTAQVSSKTGPASTISELDKARAELDRSLIIYKETHPTIRNLRRKIETLEKASATEAKQPVKSDIATDLVVSKIHTQIQAAKARLNSLSDQKSSLQLRINQLQAQVAQSPQVERGLFTLMRDYENAKSKYEEVKSKQVNAKIAQNLESENKAERFTLLEPPIYPDKPSKPNRKKLIGMGVVGALGGSIAFIALMEMLDKRVRGVEAVSALTNMRPLVVIPYIYTQAQLDRRKHLLRYVVIAFVALVILSLLIIHLLVMPVDLLVVKLMAKLG